MKVTFITHMEMNKSELSNLYPKRRGSILVEDDVYIGVNATILMNTLIGIKSIIAAGSLVNCNVDKGIMAGGVPVKVIKQLKQ